MIVPDVGFGGTFVSGSPVLGCAQPVKIARNCSMGSVVKKRRKRMAKKKHRKLLRRTRVQRRNKK